MATVLKLGYEQLADQSPIDVQVKRHLPPGTTILATGIDFHGFGMSVLVEYPVGWCVHRVSGNHGDLAGADYDYGEDRNAE